MIYGHREEDGKVYYQVQGPKADRGFKIQTPERSLKGLKQIINIASRDV